MGLALILGPILLAAVAAAVPSNRLRPWLLPIGSGLHLLAVLYSLSVSRLSAWESELGLGLDPLAKLFLPIVSGMHFLCMLYAPSYLFDRLERSNRVMCTCMLGALGIMTLVLISHNLGLLWVAVEGTTLVSAPSIYFNHNHRSLEATWKYLLICSVGIALALLGTFFLAYAALYAGAEPTLQLEHLLAGANKLSPIWLQAAFILLLVGYGTKMGLAPMHTWKPDAYGEAPGVLGAVMAGAVTNCAFFAVLRFYHICEAAGQGEFARRLMLLMGLISIGTAAVFVIRQRDFKRLLAYSSVEHMGILVLGVGVGGEAALFGALLHVAANAATKGLLFLSAANIHRAFQRKTIEHVHGAMRIVPFSSAMLLFGLFAGCGSPPFAPFVSEFTIIAAAFENGRIYTAFGFLALLAVIFVGMAMTILSVVFGEPTISRGANRYPDRPHRCAPIAIFLAIVCLLGFYIPDSLRQSLSTAVDYLQSAPAAVGAE
jgi:hydrogenase-4 component F